MSYGQVGHKARQTLRVSLALHPDLPTAHPQTAGFKYNKIFLGKRKKET